MLGFITTFTRTHRISLIPIRKEQTQFPSIRIHHLSCLNSNRKNPRGFKVWFSEDREEVRKKPKSIGGGGTGNGNEEEEDDDDIKKKGGGGGGGFNIRWSELVFDPDPDNVVAVGLTGVLAWASVQVLWQLFVISFAILIAALKYSFIAALLIFILITLL